MEYVMRTIQLQKRRALVGKADEKKVLIDEHRFTSGLIDHLAIRCYDAEPLPELVAARQRLEEIENRLLQITK